jgi:hypothetical protein
LLSHDPIVFASDDRHWRAQTAHLTWMMAVVPGLGMTPGEMHQRARFFLLFRLHLGSGQMS